VVPTRDRLHARVHSYSSRVTNLKCIDGPILQTSTRFFLGRLSVPASSPGPPHASGRLGVSEPDSEEVTGRSRVDHQAAFGLRADFRLTGPAPGSPA
jgi:hypothetical protein